MVCVGLSGEVAIQTDHFALLRSFSDSHIRIEDNGWTRQTTVRELAASSEVAGVNMRLGPGVIRELHWHKEAEWAYVLSGRSDQDLIQRTQLTYRQAKYESPPWIPTAVHSSTTSKLVICGTSHLDTLTRCKGSARMAPSFFSSSTAVASLRIRHFC